MLSFLQVCIINWAATFANAGLCDPVLIEYNIGMFASILNVQAEEISQMRQSCSKDIQIPGAKASVFNVVSADFGYNTAYEYGGLIGTNSRRVYDKIYVQFGKCSTETKPEEITADMSKHFTSENICLHILPEIDHRALGTHVPGDRIQLNVRVDIAICPERLAPMLGPCQPLCGASGQLHNCETETTLANSSPTVTTELSVTTKIQSQIPSTSYAESTTSKSTKTVTSIHYTLYPNTVQTYTTVQLTKPSATTINTTTLSSTPMHFNPVKTPITSHELTGNSLSTSTSKVTTAAQSSSISTSVLQNVVTTTKEASANNLSTKASKTDFTVSTNIAGFTPAQVVTRSFTHPAINSEENVTTPSLNDDEKIGVGNHIFGLLEGLYVIVGCIVLLLILGILAFLIRRKKSDTLSGGSTAGSAPRSGLHWRDNWLVRYHNTDIESDNISQPESDILCIHGNFLNQSNTELHHIHYSGNEDIIKNKSSEDPYDNPWPLVRLDSDFVKNARSLERNRSNADSNATHDEKCETEVMTINGGTKNDRPDHENTDLKRSETGSDGKNFYHNKHHFPKHIGSPMAARGKYNIAKVERSNSKKSFKNSFKNSQRFRNSKTGVNGTEHRRTKSESRLNQTESSLIKHPRQRNSSSMSSEYGPTFEEMLKDEIHSIENALDMNCIGDTESNGIDCQEKKNWRVSTLYAIVSSRNGVSPNDIVITRQPSQKKTNNEVIRSESYRKAADIVTKSRQINSATSRTTSLHKDKNLSQKRYKAEANLTEDFENETKLEALKQDYKITREMPEKNQTNNGSNKSTNLTPEETPRSEIHEAEKVNLNENKHKENDQEEILQSRETRSTFQQNRERFEQNGSITQDCRANTGVSGTGQFPK